MAFKATSVGGLGKGELGDVAIASACQINSYANVASMSADGQTLTIGTALNGVYGAFTVGQEILFHTTGCLTAETTNMGKYGFATILAVNGSQLIIDKPIPIIDLSKYVCQIVTVPHFGNLTVNCQLSALAYDVTNKCGGILIVKSKNNIDLSNGMLLVEGKGLPNGSALKPAGVSNANLLTKLVMSTGNGIVLPICNTLKVTALSRIGASWSGALGAGIGAFSTWTKIAPDANGAIGGNSFGGTEVGVEPGGLPGYGPAKLFYYGAIGGFGGACVFIVANVITGFILDVISTGGGGGTGCSGSAGSSPGTPGGAGFGGGGGGGSSGCGGGGGGGAGGCYIATNTSLPTNTIAYALDTLSTSKTGLLISTNTQLDCSTFTSVDGFTITGSQPSGTDRRFVFKVNSGVAGARTYPISTNTVAGDTVVVNGVTFTAIASGATGNQFNVGANTTITAINLAATLNTNATINALYMATASTNIVTLTEKTAGGGNTPGAATKTGTIVIDAGTATTSVGWQKISGTGAVTLTNVTTQAITVDSVLAEGNTVAELLLATSIAGFIGKKITPVIALSVPDDGTTLAPTAQLTINGHSSVAQQTYTALSPIYTLANQDVTVISATSNATTTNSGTVTVTAAIMQNNAWSAFMPLASVLNQKASKIQFQSVYAAPTIGTSTAQLNSVNVAYRTNNANVSGTLAELISNTEVFPEGMSGIRLLVKHQKLFDAQLAAYASFRPQPLQRSMLNIGVGTGARQTIQLADTSINHATLQVFAGTNPAGVFDYNTALSQVSVTAPAGVTIFASYQCNWQPENWVQMTKCSTDTYNYEPGINSTEFTYQLPNQTAQGISATKVQLLKPVGTVTNAPLGTATGSQQMYVLPHAAVPNTIVLTDGTNPVNSWSYDQNTRIITVVATQGKNLLVSYTWAAEIPLVTGFVAAWNQ